MASVFAKIIAFFTSIIMFFQAIPQGIFGTLFPPEVNEVKNVIVLIGDGMGFNSLEKAKKECGIESLVMESLPLKGESMTRSLDNETTDSAAGATAISTATRVNNGAVAVFPEDPNAKTVYPMSLTELAIEQGKATGVVTTDSTSGATPAGFSVHSSSRNNEEDITTKQLKSDIDLIWGYETASFTEEAADKNGFEYIYDKASMEALEPGTRSFGQFTEDLWHNEESDSVPQLYEMTEKAIDLLDDDEDGFFLMVEGAHIDKNNHKNNAEGMEDALQSFDKAVEVALNYAKEKGDTLVVITADHETGGITLIDGEYQYTSGSHSSANVPLFVYGCDTFMKQGEAICNRQIGERIALCMGEKDFPRRVKAA